MDAGMAIKPAVSVVTHHAQPTFGFSPAAQPELPGAKSIGPVKKDDPTRNEPRHDEPKSTTRDAIIDPETSAVVYRVRDAITGQVVHQEPDQAMLRAQAYARAQAARALASGSNLADARQPAVVHVDETT